jgi:transposase-like protein
MRTATTAGLVTSTAEGAKLPVTVDTRGRVRISNEQRRLILDEFERSGVSGAEFARRCGLKYSTLAGWRQRQRRSQKPRRLQPVRLLEAVLPEPSPLLFQNSAERNPMPILALAAPKAMRFRLERHPRTRQIAP